MLGKKTDPTLGAERIKSTKSLPMAAGWRVFVTFAARMSRLVLNVGTGASDCGTLQRELGQDRTGPEAACHCRVRPGTGGNDAGIDVCACSAQFSAH